MRMLDMAHRDYGRLAWSGLFDEGVRLASGGFTIPARMGSAISSNAASFANSAKSSEKPVSEV